MDFEALPGGDLIRQGLADLEQGVDSVPALLVLIGAPRLRRLGLEVCRGAVGGSQPAAEETPERRLYALLSAEDPDAAHGRYNSLIRRLVSFERAAECAAR